MFWGLASFLIQPHCRFSKAYKRQKLCNFHIKDLPFAFRGICLLRERHLYLLKVIFFKIYRILPLRGKKSFWFRRHFPLGLKGKSLIWKLQSFCLLHAFCMPLNIGSVKNSLYPRNFFICDWILGLGFFQKPHTNRQLSFVI